MRTLEWTWTILGAISFSAGLSSLYDAHQDSAAMRSAPYFRPYGPRAVILRRGEQVAWTRLIVQGTFMLVGALALATPRPRVRTNRRSQGIASVLFILMEGLLTWDALADRWSRRKINMLLDRDYREREMLRVKKQGETHHG